MTQTITGSYDSVDQLKNTREELTAKGIPQDKVVVDESKRTIAVVIPDATAPEVTEIFDRHEIHRAT